MPSTNSITVKSTELGMSQAYQLEVGDTPSCHHHSSSWVPLTFRASHHFVLINQLYNFQDCLQADTLNKSVLSLNSP